MKVKVPEELHPQILFKRRLSNKLVLGLKLVQECNLQVERRLQMKNKVIRCIQNQQLQTE